MNLSFSNETKNEICSVKIKGKCCRKSMLYGILFGSTVFTNDRILLETDNPMILSCYGRLLREICSFNVKAIPRLSDITDKNIISVIMALLGVESVKEIDSRVMLCENCCWSFVRGVFLSAGTITSPKNAYHMEFLFKSREQSDSLCQYLSSLGEPPKTIERRDSFGVYYKDSETVVDLLGHMGASDATFKLLDVKIYRDLRNNINRVSNCEVANMGKTVHASSEQMKAIERIITSGMLGKLPEELRATLDLRAAFPQATLGELAEKHTPPITKSGVNHRLRRIVEFADKC